MLDSLDISLLRKINVERITSLDSVFQFITNSGPTIAALIPISIILYGLFRKQRDIWMKGFMIAAPYLLSVVVSNTLKYIISRPRPFSIFPYIQKLSSGGNSSFPSGHTSDAFSIAMIISLFFPKLWIIIPVFVWAILVGYSRMDLGVHYPSDVLAGASIGIFSSLFCFWLYKRSRRDKMIIK